MQLKVTKIGSSLGALMPKEMIEGLGVNVGDTLWARKSKDGFDITPYDPEFEDQMCIARDVMRENKDVLRELAK